MYARDLDRGTGHFHAPKLLVFGCLLITCLPMDSQGRLLTDLHDKLAALHIDIEQQLHDVATAVSHLDHFFFSQRESKTTRHNLHAREQDTTASKDTTERALVGRRLHSIRSEGQRRMLHTLSLQRMLLWKSVKSSERAGPFINNAAACCASEGGPHPNFAASSTDTASSSVVHVSAQHGEDGDAASEDNGAWKHHTLVILNRFLRKKAADQNETAAERCNASRDMAKIDVELARLSTMHRLRTADVGIRSDKPRFSSSASEVRLTSLEASISGEMVAFAMNSVGTGLARPTEARSQRASHDMKKAPSLIASGRSKDDSHQTSGNISSRTTCEAVHEEGESTEEGVSNDVVTMGNYVRFSPRSRPERTTVGRPPLAEEAVKPRQLLEEVELRLPDGLDSWLSRITDGVRSSPGNSISAPAAQPSQRRTPPIQPDRSRSLIAHNGSTPSMGESRNTPRDTRNAATPAMALASTNVGSRLETTTRRRETSDQSIKQCVGIENCGAGGAGQAGGRANKTTGDKVKTETRRIMMSRFSSVFAENATRPNGEEKVDTEAGGGQVQVVTRLNINTVNRRAPLQAAAQLGSCMPYCFPPSVGDTFRGSSTHAKSAGRREGISGGDKENIMGDEK